jgi:hypothetical protein
MDAAQKHEQAKSALNSAEAQLAAAMANAQRLSMKATILFF